MSDELVVTRATTLCPDVREIVLTHPDGGILPSFAPGSHIGLHCGAGPRNSYSLTGDGLDPRHYAISVRLDPAGRGGSRWAHGLRPGDRVRIDPPRSAFAPVATARHHLLVAGGIGVTPLLAHVRAALTWGRSFHLYYAHRPGRGAHLDELRALCGDRLRVAHSATALWAALGPALRRQPLGTHLYVCGPAALNEAVTAAAAAAGWPEQRVHTEAFAAPPVAPGAPFTVRLARSGREFAVGAEQTMLDALLAEGAAVPNLCRQGVCGECRLPVRSGRAEHRDSFLTADERGTAVLPCVSRATGRLELEL
ncbi:PDR/VanB family oxidoreductase [Nocardia asteroides]|uniref:PDR/VanB family oxidoreductase n=1 Tax=Nocardia asteroides TaxID=1824 RepID=UPI001E5E6DBE|nr:PDR/VanB family oxidoreductase [Nocardia asteroides]UGT59091.1 PDR/VanB family oxidoreductase [Nocardia asteroides]